MAAASRNGSWKAVGAFSGVLLVISGIILSVCSALLYWTPYSRALTFSAAGACGVGIFLMIWCNIRPDWVEAANLRQADIAADEVGDFFRLMPVLLSGQLAFGAVYSSMSFWFQLQACQMDTRIIPGSPRQFAGSFFNLADCIAIIACTPIIVGFVTPFVESKVGGRVSVGSKFLTGIFFGVASVVAAIGLELYRRSTPSTGISSNCAPAGVEMSTLSGAWMIAPYALMGIAEIYTQPSMMYFAYNQSPASMRTLSAVISLFMKGATAAMFSIVSILLKSILPNDLNNGHIEYGYVLNIGITMFFVAIFHVMMKRFQWKTFD